MFFIPVGILAGVWSANDLGFQLGAIVILLLPVFVGLLFAVSSLRGKEDSAETRGHAVGVV